MLAKTLAMTSQRNAPQRTQAEQFEGYSNRHILELGAALKLPHNVE
ncbi:hypothetical protein [Microcoleus sp. FACHB-672]|nr:hypothetical protein [Microcoleus sp. FACHB-672]MBD2042949.1 hypothetical protein [Microcoleus sp. FACHB-672]